MIRLGLCCQFAAEPIAFRRATAAGLRGLSRPDRLARLAAVCRHNAEALAAALEYCGCHGMGAFRINSQILPLRTHPEVGYEVNDLPGADAIREGFAACARQARRWGLRLSFHPDQFVVLSAPDPGVRDRSVEELLYQAEVAEWLGAEVINIHAGGGYGDKPAALARLRTAIAGLPAALHSRLTLENDDRVYTPADLIPVCRDVGVPFVYDVHHHRCLGDDLSIAVATAAAQSTWGGREPLFHLSSPKGGWDGSAVTQHDDYVEPRDFPVEWQGLTLTVDVEAKAKELAVLRLREALHGRGLAVWPAPAV